MALQRTITLQISSTASQSKVQNFVVGVSAIPGMSVTTTGPQNTVGLVRVKLDNPSADSLVRLFSLINLFQDIFKTNPPLFSPAEQFLNPFSGPRPYQSPCPLSLPLDGPPKVLVGGVEVYTPGLDFTDSAATLEMPYGLRGITLSVSQGAIDSIQPNDIVEISGSPNAADDGIYKAWFADGNVLILVDMSGNPIYDVWASAEGSTVTAQVIFAVPPPQVVADIRDEFTDLLPGQIPNNLGVDLEQTTTRETSGFDMKILGIFGEGSDIVTCRASDAHGNIGAADDVPGNMSMQLRLDDGGVAALEHKASVMYQMPWCGSPYNYNIIGLDFTNLCLEPTGYNNWKDTLRISLGKSVVEFNVGVQTNGGGSVVSNWTPDAVQLWNAYPAAGINSRFLLVSTPSPIEPLSHIVPGDTVNVINAQNPADNGAYTVDSVLYDVAIVLTAAGDWASPNMSDATGSSIDYTVSGDIVLPPSIVQRPRWHMTFPPSYSADAPVGTHEYGLWFHDVLDVQLNEYSSNPEFSIFEEIPSVFSTAGDIQISRNDWNVNQDEPTKLPLKIERILSDPISGQAEECGIVDTHLDRIKIYFGLLS